MSTTNTAAWILEVEGPWVVREATYYPQGPAKSSSRMALLQSIPVRTSPYLILQVCDSNIVSKTVDWRIQSWGKRLPFPKSYPAIVGADVAGEIYEVGEGVTDFKKDDRVIGKSNWFLTSRPQDGGFQHYTTCSTVLVAHLPDNIPFKAGCVLPLALSTAAMGLYPSYRFGLPFPRLEPKPLNKILLVWGGSSSCGSAAIQLAVASGATVIATASAKNFEFVKSIGGSVVLDYHDEDIGEQLVEEVKKLALEFGGEFKEHFVGALDAIAEDGDKTWKACAQVVRKLGGGKVVTFWPMPRFEDCPEGVELLPVNDTSQLGQSKDIVEAIWGRYFPEGLKAGTLKAVPEPVVVGKGLEKIADGVDMLRKGVSAAKIVVEL